MKFRNALIASFCAVVLATAASATPDESGSGDIVEPNGFPGICDQPCFTATKSFEVYLAGNATGPGTCAAGENEYVYQITHTGGTGTPLGFIPALTRFELGVETDDVGSASYMAGFGINPSSVTVDGGTDTVGWEFVAPTIPNGANSTKLIVCSVLLPGSLTDTMISVDGQASLDAPGTCVGPVNPPAAGDPMPCTIGFWKNRADGKKGTLQHFPNGDFDVVVTAAVALSGGLFADEAALLTALQSKGNRTPEERSLQQFAALVLDLAAGNLFPENSKCRLFGANTIDANSCGTDLTIQQAVDQFFTWYNNGQFNEAKDCADDINNGIGVTGATEGS